MPGVSNNSTGDGIGAVLFLPWFQECPSILGFPGSGEMAANSETV